MPIFISLVTSAAAVRITTNKVSIFCERTMLRLDEKPLFFRFSVVILLLMLTAVASINLYYQASTVTDENLFTNVPGRLMVTEPIPVEKAAMQEAPANHPDDVSPTLPPGTIIGLINNHEPESLTHALMLLQQFSSTPDTLLLLEAGIKKRKMVVVDGSVIDDSMLLWLPPSVVVIDVAKNGASDRAGMKVGDIIVRINGQFFKNAQGADRIMRQASEKRTIDYEILRNGQPVTLAVTLARFGIQFSILFFLLSALFYILFGVFITLARPQIKAARLLGLAFLLSGFYIALMLNQAPLPQWSLTHVRNIALAFCALFGIAVAIHTDYYFPIERPKLLETQWPRYVVYSIAAVYFILGFTAIGRNIYVIGVLNLAILHLIIKAIFGRKENKEHKHLFLLIKWSGILTGFLVFGLALLSSVTKQPRLLGLAGIPLLLIPLAHLYTIARYKLLNLNLRLRRNIQYSIFSAAWIVLMTAIAVLIFYLLLSWQVHVPNIRLTGTAIEVLDQPLDIRQHLFAEKGIVMVLGLVILWVLYRLYHRGRRIINEKYYRASYDYRRSTTVFNEVLAMRTGVDDLAQRLARQIAELVHLKRVATLIFRDGRHLSAQACWGCPQTEANPVLQQEASSMLNLLNEYSAMPRFHVDYTPKLIKDLMRRGDFRYLIPVRSNQTIQAGLLVGEKLSEAPYYQEDLDFLDVIAKQSAVAIENMFLYEEVAKQERLRHELELARRIQMSSLPRQLPDITGLEITAVSAPATEVGGDYYDYLLDEGQTITIIVGDVSGKGISAALYMAKIQGIVRSLHTHSANPRELFISTNRVLSENLEKNYFITAIGARFDLAARKMQLSRAGHLPLFYYRAKEDSVQLITPKGMGLGLSANGLFADELEMYEMTFATGDICMFVTDGITEAISNQDSPSGESHLLQLLKENARQPLPALRDRIMDTARACQGRDRAPADDQTLVAIRIT